METGMLHVNCFSASKKLLLDIVVQNIHRSLSRMLETAVSSTIIFSLYVKAFMCVFRLRLHLRELSRRQPGLRAGHETDDRVRRHHGREDRGHPVQELHEAVRLRLPGSAALLEGHHPHRPANAGHRAALL